MHVIASEHIFSYTAQLAPPDAIGPVPEGLRINFYVTDGLVGGPRVRGKLKPVGADRFVLRSDGIGLLDVAIVIQTDDGAVIDMSYPGVCDTGAEVTKISCAAMFQKSYSYAQLPNFRCAHPDYQWLHRKMHVGVGEIDMTTQQVSYDVYAII